MALSADELEQIRAVVRSEIAKSRGWNSFLVFPGILVVIFIAVLGLHVLVIGGFTLYHLMAH